VDVCHLLARGELAVRDVEEVRPPDQCQKTVPGLDVRLVVGEVAVQQAVRQRDRAVRADRERQDELLQLRAVVF
jgi:hypothetical protein